MAGAYPQVLISPTNPLFHWKLNIVQALETFWQSSLIDSRFRMMTTFRAINSINGAPPQPAQFWILDPGFTRGSSGSQ